MIKCSKCGAIFGKMVDNCFYCGGVGTVEEVDNSAVVEEVKEEEVKEVKEEPKEEIVEEVKEEVPKKKRGRKKKSE